MADLIRMLESGNLSVFIIAGLMMGLLWVTAQWRKAEAGRIEDLKTIVALGVEVKNNINTLIELIKGDRRDR